MEFLRTVPVVELVDEGSTHSTFFAEVFEKRPEREEIYNSQGFARALEEAFGEALQKTKSGIKSVFFFIDAAGMFMVVTFTRRVSTSHAKMHTDVVVRALPEKQRRVIEKTLRACDELDKDRIAAMTTIQACKPTGVAEPAAVRQTKPTPKTLAELIAASSSEEEEEESRLCVQAPSALQVFQTRPTQTGWHALATSDEQVQLRKEVDRIEEELSAHCGHDSWVSVPRPSHGLRGVAPLCTVCLRQADVLFKCANCGTLACDPCRSAGKTTTAEHDAFETARDEALCKLHEFDGLVAHAAWAELAESYASIKVAGVGEQNLTCVRIYKPERRMEFLRNRLPKGAGLVETVRVAKGLLEAGALQKMSLEHRGRKSEFLKFCCEALKLANPDAETNPKQLPPRQQQQLALVLDTTLRYCHCCGKVAQDPVCLEDLAGNIEWFRGFGDEDDDGGFSWPEILRAKFACRKTCAGQVRVWSCVDCGGEDVVPDGPSMQHNKMLLGFVKCAHCSGKMQQWDTHQHRMMLQAKNRERVMFIERHMRTPPVATVIKDSSTNVDRHSEQAMQDAAAKRARYD